MRPQRRSSSRIPSAEGEAGHASKNRIEELLPSEPVHPRRRPRIHERRPGPAPHPSATVLADGRILIVGGNNETDESYRTAEIYDPAAGTFTATGSMAEERTCAMATLLPNGKVLVAGGYDTAGTFSATAEIYEPSTGEFEPRLTMHYEHSCHCQVLLDNDLVLLTTGCTGAERAELFDWKTETFTAIGDMTVQRKYPFFQKLEDGRVLIAGGQSSGVSVKSAEIYIPDPAGGRGRFELLASELTTARWRGAHGLLPDGRVLLLGGTTTLVDGSNGYLDTAEIFDPTTDSFSGEFKMSEARAGGPDSCRRIRATPSCSAVSAWTARP